MRRALREGAYGPGAVATVVIAVYGVAIAWSVQAGVEVVRAIVTGHVLLAAGLLLLSILVRRNQDGLGFGLLALAFAGKLLSVGPRYFTLVVLYGGSGDAVRYDEVGRTIAASLRSGGLQVETVGKVPGTGFVELLTGIVYSVTGPSLIAGFLVYSFLGFWGQYLFYRAFVIAVPDGNHRRFGYLVLFMPSLVFWPSGIGKEAWVMLCLGLAAHGVASHWARRPSGLPTLILGLSACSLVRPHMALLFVVALGGALVARGAGRRWSPGRVALIAVVVVGSVLALQQVQELFGETSVEAAVDLTQRRSSGGESAFDAPGSSLTGLPYAVVSVLLRPFPWEARNPQSLLISMEGVVVLHLVWRQRSGWREIGRRIRANPYVRLCAIYSVGFCIAFANIGNFGILARQRSQLYPFLFALLSIGAASTSVATGAAARTGERHRPSQERVAS